MAEKKLVMKFATAGGGQTSMTLSDAKQDLDEVTVKTAMQSMCDSAAFATTKGAAYTAPLAASVKTRMKGGLQHAVIDNRKRIDHG